MMKHRKFSLKYMIYIVYMICLFNSVHADESIYINSQQLNEAEQSAKVDINEANIKTTYIQPPRVSESVLQQQIMQVQNTINDAKNQTAPIEQINSTGEKYYIFSDKLDNDSKEQAALNQSHSPINANQLINYYNRMKDNKDSISEGRVLIFISMTMPKKSIMNLIKQGQKVGAVFVLMGLVDGSIKKTQREFYSLMQGNQVGAMINPQLFRTFNIKMVPTFVIYAHAKQNPLNTGCKVAPKFVSLSGDVNLHFALTEMAKKSELSGLADNYLTIMAGKSFYLK